MKGLSDAETTMQDESSLVILSSLIILILLVTALFNAPLAGGLALGSLLGLGAMGLLAVARQPDE
jgi:hypothetical protein